MGENEFRELIRSGLGEAIIYARNNDVRVFRDVIVDACLHCCSVDVQSEGTRAGYMLELVSLMSDRQFYCEKVLEALPGSPDDWDGVQRFHFATYMAFDGDEHARQLLYENFKPGPNMGEAIAIDFVRLDGLKGFLFAAAKIGALLISRPDEVDEGWLWSQAVEICGEQDAKTALIQAGTIDPCIEAYRLRAVEGAGSRRPGFITFAKLRLLSYEQVRQDLPRLRAYQLSDWGTHASAEDAESAAHGLLAAHSTEEQRQYLRIFLRRAFPLDHAPLLELTLSVDEEVAFAGAVALSQIVSPSVREIAFRLIEERRSGREAAMAMLSENWLPNDHEIVLNWFQSESDRNTRHYMQRALRDFWERHPDPATEARMLRSIYEKGPCSFCREFVVRRLIELDALPTAMMEQCACDANDEVRKLVDAV